MKEMLLDVFHDFSGPVVTGLAAGHCNPALTLPMGCPVTLTTDPPGLYLNEPSVT